MPLLAGYFLCLPSFEKKEMFMNEDQREIQHKLHTTLPERKRNVLYLR